MLQPGVVFQGFRILSCLGRGSYGYVYQVENTVTWQRLALKIVPLSGNAGRRELNALRVFQDIEHPNLLKIHHAGMAGEELFYTMDLAECPIAEKHLSPEALRIAAGKLADALACLHRAGLLHRDIKPDNLFWRGNEPILGDIGLMTTPENATVSGTPGFLSPRILLHGQLPDAAADVYSLAKSFYCLLSGNSPKRYPDYDGPCSADAKILLNAILNVCDEKGMLPTAETFRDALRSPAPHFRNGVRRYALLLLLILPAAGAFFLFRNAERRPQEPTVRSQLKADPHPEYAAIRKALAEFDEESRRVQPQLLKQNAVAQKLKEAGIRYAEQQLPDQNGVTSIDKVVTRHAMAREHTRKLQRERGVKDPAFRCFFLHWEDLEQDAIPLRIACDDSERLPFPETEFREWRKKWQLYQTEKKSLSARQGL